MLNENKKICWLCEKKGADSNIGVVHLKTEGMWERQEERKILLWFHKDCFEEQSEKISIQATTVCLFCNINVRELHSGDLIIQFLHPTIAFKDYYIWMHRQCWNENGISLE